jgi:hypothetical protein
MVATLGAVALGLWLFRSSPRDVVLVYDLDGASGARSLEVVIRKDEQVVRRATFPSPGVQVRHAVRLTDGSYRVDYRLELQSGSVAGERDIAVTESQTIVLSLGR